MRHLFAWTGLGLCLAVVLAATLSPTPIDQGYESAIERVLSILHRNGVPQWFGYRWLEFSANIAMFVPLAYFLSLVFPTRFLWLALPLTCPPCRSHSKRCSSSCCRRASQPSTT